MRWVLITDDHPPLTGGVATWTARVAAGLRDAGEAVDVYARARPGLPPDVHAVSGPSFARWGHLWMRYAVRLDPDDVVLACTWPPAAWLPVDHVVFHGSDLTSRTPGRVCRTARRWTVSRFLGDLLRARHGLDSAVLPAPIEVRPASTSTNPAHWGYIARATDLKGGDRFVRLVAAAGVRGTLIGDGPSLASWKALAAEIDADVTFVGGLSRAEVLARIADFDVVLLLPRPGPEDAGTEGLGLVLLEAAAAGVAVVGCRTGGVPEAVGPGLVLDDPDVPGAAAAVLDWWTPERGTDARDWLAATHGVARTVAALQSARG